MNRRMQCSIYGLASALALFALSSPRVCAQGTETPKTANRFCDSIGINTHLFGQYKDAQGGYHATPYTTGTFYNNVQLPLAWLGVRHIRDYMSVDDAGYAGDSQSSNPGYLAIFSPGYTASSDTADDYYNRLKQLGSQGVKCDLSIHPVGWSWYGNPMVPQSWDITNTFLLGCQEAVEGANEWDRSGDANWESELNSETSDIWSDYRGNPSTAGMQIYSGTITDVHGDPGGPNGGSYPDTTNYVHDFGNVSGKVDYGNCHPYCYSAGPLNNNPEAGLPHLISGWQPLWGPLPPAPPAPFVITETGYYTGTAQNSVSPIVQEKYTLRTLFTAFNLGAYRTYLYELYDQYTETGNPESNFGLISNDGTVKYSYNALESLIGVLSDSSTSTAVTPLTWSLSGNTTNVNHTLLQKADGSYYLALWLGGASTDATASQGVTVTVPSTIAAGTLYSINQYGSPYSNPVTITKGKMSFNVTDTVSLLKLTGPVVESTALAVNPTTVSRNGGTVTASVTFQNVSASAITILPYIAARDQQGNNDDFGSGGKGNVTLSPGQTVSVSVTKTLATWMNTGTWSVFASYQTPSDGHWYSFTPTLPLTVTN